WHVRGPLPPDRRRKIVLHYRTVNQSQDVNEFDLNALVAFMLIDALQLMRIFHLDVRARTALAFRCPWRAVQFCKLSYLSVFVCHLLSGGLCRSVLFHAILEEVYHSLFDPWSCRTFNS
ncbi:hypothetical protein PHET_07721, partial [Paragonimus heterotremus]